MHLSMKLGITALATALAGPIWAEATEAGAERLKAVLQTYLGSTEGVVGVAVAGEAYAVSVDVSPLMALVGEGLMTSTATPVEALVTDNGDGTWSYAIDQPFAIGLWSDDVMQTSTSYETMSVEGVFDEALGDMSRYSVKIGGIKTVQIQTDASLGDVTTQSTTESLVLEGTAKAAASGIDGNFDAISSGMAFDLILPSGEGMAPMQVSGTVAAGATAGTVLGYQPKPIYALLAWFVAHPSEELIDADKAQLKPLIEAALPFFGSASIEGSYSTISLTTPLGVFELGDMGFAFEMDGVVANGRLREAITLRGLKVPEGAVPPFARALLPEEISLDVTASGFDLAGAVRQGLGSLDQPEGAPGPDGFDMQLLMALLPEGAVDVTLAPGGARGAAYDLAIEGAMRAGMDGMPSGTAKVTLSGIEAIMAALAEAPPEMAVQALPFVGMAQAMGQPGPEGQLVWEIDASTPGSLRINGMDIMGMQ